MSRQRLRRARRKLLGGRPREVALGWAAGAVYTIVTFTAATEGLVPMTVASIGGIVAGLAATTPAPYRWGDGASTGAHAATLAAVTFAVYFLAHLLHLLYVITGDYFLVVAPSYALIVGIGVVIGFVLSGGLAGLVVFKVKGWMLRNEVGHIRRRKPK
ncbi:hypothetical protein [Haloprofundus salilacus]|uniref:hypothetical protein n=1 Tax=Haloprofundus salilacus TaxID=2876190 RepID=UPI001CCCA668|nr:hypothetical protein [Haloprofundus salilacus]